MAEVWAGTMIGDWIAKRKIKKKGAISEETARTPEELGVHESILREFEKLGYVRKTFDGHYYLACEKRC